MSVFIEFVSQFAPYIYAVCGLVALWYLRMVLTARRERRQAIFSLEREAALNTIYNTWGIAFFLLIVMGAVYFIGNTLTEALPPAEGGLLVTSTPLPGELLPTPTPTPEPTPTHTPTPTRVPRPVRRPTPIPAPTKPSVTAPACPDPRARITAPGVNTTMRGAIQIMGTANVERFQFYKLEFRSSSEAGAFHYITGSETAVVNGFLGVWDTSGLPSGTYLLRLTVVDATGNFPIPCDTTVIVP